MVNNSHFMIVYTKVLNFVNDLIVLSLFKSQLASKTIEEAVQFLNEVKAHLEASTHSYKQHADKKRFKTFSTSDLVMSHISKGRTPVGTYSKL